MTDNWEQIDGEFEPLDWVETNRSDDRLTDRYSYASYIVADDDNTTHDYDEIPTGSKNRWSFFSYFTDPPDPESCGDNCAHSTQYTNANLRLEAADGPNEQSNITFNNWYPQDQEELVSFGVGLGAPFGPVAGSVSVAKSVDASDVNVDPVPYHYLECDQSFGSLSGGGSSFPDSYEDAIGIHFDVDVQEKAQEERITANVLHEWVFYRTDSRGREILYSREDSHIGDLWADFEVIVD
ncbi:hypothetical protein [Natrarchaeobius oligotrophus]|uniref:hypothetical protein n=1 Tax=Natrarchaeobius oligotrophus TaxID=3455743 RepID=UPI000F51F102|nr:hypothetical protein [Natrarchaeobius chitinivorans]